MKAFLLVDYSKQKSKRICPENYFFFKIQEYLLQAPLIGSDFQKKVRDRVMFNNHEL